jgi:hypothetical protein
MDSLHFPLACENIQGFLNLGDDIFELPPFVLINKQMTNVNFLALHGAKMK